MKKVLGTGLSGLVGSKVVELNQQRYAFENLDLSNPTNPVDITNAESVMQAVAASEAKVVLHFAAFTDVTKAWEQKGDTTGIVYQVNVQGTKNLIAACEATQKHLLHISTAYVFDGNKAEPYLETDSTNPIEWYGTTKALAEEAVQAASCPWTILRIDQPFRSDNFAKKDVAHRIINDLKNGTLPPLFTDHFFGPTFIDDFALVVDWVIRTGSTGLYHTTSGEMWNDFEFGSAIQKSLNLPGEIVQGSLQNYLQTHERPYQKNTALNCQLLHSKLDFTPIAIAEAISKLEQ